MSITRSTTIWCDQRWANCAIYITFKGIDTKEQIETALEFEGWTTDDDHATHICKECRYDD